MPRRPRKPSATRREARYVEERDPQGRVVGRRERTVVFPQDGRQPSCMRNGCCHLVHGADTDRPYITVPC